MAYVRKTDTLVNDIRWKIRRMSDKAIEATGTDKLETGSPIHQELVETALTAAWSDAPTLRGKLPDAWLNKYKRFDVVFKRPDGTKVTPIYTRASIDFVSLVATTLTFTRL